MNLYLCSTVRHVMLSVLKAVDEPQQQSTLLVIVDQQNLKPESFCLESLPENITVKFIKRKGILSRVYRGLSGWCLKIAATCNVKPSRKLIEHTRRVVIENELKIPVSELSILYLFNDRNRLSRLLRLSFDEYSVLEDGLSNYSGIKLSVFDRLSKLFNDNKNKFRYIGDSARCKEILLLNAHEAPAEISHKTKSIDFIKSNNVKKFCYPFFKVVETLNANVDSIVATQPISVGELTKSNFDLVIYEKMLKALNNKNKKVVFKVHPRECLERYLKAFPNVEFIKGKVPLELVIFGLENKSAIYSIYSSAGMGFESYCERKTIIREDEVSKMADVFESWKKDNKKLEDRLKSII